MVDHVCSVYRQGIHTISVLPDSLCGVSSRMSADLAEITGVHVGSSFESVVGSGLVIKTYGSIQRPCVHLDNSYESVVQFLISND